MYDPRSPASADYGPSVGMGKGLVGRGSNGASPLRSPIMGSSYERYPHRGDIAKQSPLRNRSRGNESIRGSSPLRNNSDAMDKYKPIALQYLDRVSNNHINYLDDKAIDDRSRALGNNSPLRKRSGERSSAVPSNLMTRDILSQNDSRRGNSPLRHSQGQHLGPPAHQSRPPLPDA